MRLVPGDIEAAVVFLHPFGHDPEPEVSLGDVLDRGNALVECAVVADVQFDPLL